MSEYLNKRDASKQFGISRTRLDRLIKNGLVGTYNRPGNEQEILIKTGDLQKALNPQPIGFNALMDLAFREGLHLGHNDQVANEPRTVFDIHAMAEASAVAHVTEDSPPYMIAAYVGTYMQGYTRGLHETNFG